MAEKLQKLSSEELKALREQLKKEASLAMAEAPKPNPEAVEVKEEVKTGKRIIVEVSPDKMSAAIMLSPPGPGERYTVPEIMTTLRQRRVVLGIRTQDVMECLAEEIYDEFVDVAAGKPVSKGTDGYYEFMVELKPHNKPEIREDGSVDYSAMSRLPNVAEGETIAIYHPAIQGTKGYNVVGEELLPKPAKEQSPLRGQHISFNEETKEYKAKISGKISCINNNVQIMTVHQVNGDVALAEGGHVEFYGDIVINGNVETGVIIRAGRNVTISGTVAGAKIFAGGDINIAKGIQGNGKGKVSAKGNVFANFIEFSDVEAGGDVYANSLIDSVVNAQGKVVLDGSHGLVIGGYTHGLKGVVLKISGNEAEPKTEIHAGFKYDDYQAYLELAGREKELKNETADLINKMANLLKKGKEVGLSPEDKELIMKLKDRKDEIYKELEDIDGDKKKLATKMAEGANASINIKGLVYPNSRISVDVATLKITDKEYSTKYICKNDNIERRGITR